MSDRPALRSLADESCDFAVVRALRAAGHDAIEIAEFTSRFDDADLIAQSYRERRVLITEDKDFGWLVFVSEANSAGVILLRFSETVRTGLASAALRLVQEHGGHLQRSYAVVARDSARIPGRLAIDTPGSGAIGPRRACQRSTWPAVAPSPHTTAMKSEESQR